MSGPWYRLCAMLIDTHQHVFWHYRNDEDLIADMDAGAIDLAWLLTWEITPAEEEPQWSRILNPIHRRPDGSHPGVPLSDIVLASSRYPGRFICGYCPHPAIGNAPALFESAYHIHRVRVCGEWKFRMMFDDPRCIALFQKAGELHCPVVLHLDVPWLPDPQTGQPVAQPNWFGGDVSNLERALQMCPETMFIGHAPGFWRFISGDAQTNPQPYPTGPVMPGGRVPQLLEQYPNLYADLSAGSGLRALSRDPAHARDFLTRFADRLLFARDYYGHELHTFLESLDLPPDVQEQIYFQNAQKLVPDCDPNPPPLRKL
jgi:predicted TIM-barrel fold metal-dependent hydrolase